MNGAYSEREREEFTQKETEREKNVANVLAHNLRFHVGFFLGICSFCFRFEYTKTFIAFDVAANVRRDSIPLLYGVLNYFLPFSVAIFFPSSDVGFVVALFLISMYVHIARTHTQIDGMY